ncbi:hypothetical protein GCK32_005456, partial [Trichostrongylus colubriformis]
MKFRSARKSSVFRQRLYRPNAAARKPPTMKKEIGGSKESLISQDTTKGKRTPIRK